MLHLLARPALALAVAGNTAVLAAAETSPSLAPWLQGGGSAAAVAGLVYVARMVVKGDLVTRSVAAREAEVSAAIRVTAERELRLIELIAASHDREIALSKLSSEMSSRLGEVSALFRDANARTDRHGPR